MMHRPKRLLVEVSPQRLVDVDELDAACPHPFEVESVTNAFAASRWIESPYLTALVVDQSVGEAAAVELFRRLQNDGNGVPFVYVSTEPVVLGRFGAVLPDLILRPPVNHDILAARLDELLGAAAFNDIIIDVATRGLVDAVSSSFIPNAQLREVRFRACQIPVYEINATIPLCGEAISGRLSVSAPATTLRRLYCRMLPNRRAPNERHLEDLVGEMSNQLLGGLKRVLTSGGIDFALGVPMMYTGSSCPVRYRTRSGSLLLRIEGGDSTDEIAIDLALDSVRKGYEESVEDDAPPTGEVAFL
jgi:CheY-specific phosphatase CheX